MAEGGDEIVGGANATNAKKMLHTFNSYEEARAFIARQEIATNNKYVVVNSKNMNLTDITSLDAHKVFYTANFTVNDEHLMHHDGIPFINLGCETRECKYGELRQKNKKKDPLRIRTSKKQGCQANVRIKTVLKFPEYAVSETDKWRIRGLKKMGRELRMKFGPDTKRYLLVFVYFTGQHMEHVDNIIVPESKTLISSSTELPTCNIPSGPVLKRGATLKGKSLMDLVLQFKSTDQLPSPLAQPKYGTELTDLTEEELLNWYTEITGQVADKIFMLACKEYTMENLQHLVHLCIVFANSEIENNGNTHHSIRIKGTENDFMPLQCQDADCPLMFFHFHCPLCSTTESFIEQDTLSKHYLAKHVEPARDIAGLKILRCYDNCHIISHNNERRIFKFGHWHCFKCKNGDYKTDGYFSHIRTHLNKWGSNFSLQLAKDINNPFTGGTIRFDVDCAQAWEAVNRFKASIGHNRKKKKPVQSPNKGHVFDTFSATELNQAVVYMQQEGIDLTHHGGHQVVEEVGHFPVEELIISNAGTNSDEEFQQLKARIEELEELCKQWETENATQKSYIELLTKTVEDQSIALEKYQQEKQQLMAQLELEDSEVASTPRDKQEPMARKSILNNKGKGETVALSGSKMKSENKSSGSISSETNSLETVLAVLNNMKTDIEQLKTAALGNASAGQNSNGLLGNLGNSMQIIGQVAGLPNSAPVYLVTGQGQYSVGQTVNAKPPAATINNLPLTSTFNTYSGNQHNIYSGNQNNVPATTCSSSKTGSIALKYTSRCPVENLPHVYTCRSPYSKITSIVKNNHEANGANNETDKVMCAVNDVIGAKTVGNIATSTSEDVESAVTGAQSSPATQNTNNAVAICAAGFIRNVEKKTENLPSKSVESKTNADSCSAGNGSGDVDNNITAETSVISSTDEQTGAGSSLESHSSEDDGITTPEKNTKENSAQNKKSERNETCTSVVNVTSVNNVTSVTDINQKAVSSSAIELTSNQKLPTSSAKSPISSQSVESIASSSQIVVPTVTKSSSGNQSVAPDTTSISTVNQIGTKFISPTIGNIGGVQYVNGIPLLGQTHVPVIFPTSVLNQGFLPSITGLPIVNQFGLHYINGSNIIGQAGFPISLSNSATSLILSNSVVKTTANLQASTVCSTTSTKVDAQLATNPALTTSSGSQTHVEANKKIDEILNNNSAVLSKLPGSKAVTSLFRAETKVITPVVRVVPQVDKDSLAKPNDVKSVVVSSKSGSPTSKRQTQSNKPTVVSAKIKDPNYPIEHNYPSTGIEVKKEANTEKAVVSGVKSQNKAKVLVIRRPVTSQSCIELAIDGNKVKRTVFSRNSKAETSKESEIICLPVKRTVKKEMDGRVKLDGTQKAEDASLSPSPAKRRKGKSQ